MGDAYWRFSDSRQPQPPASTAPLAGKRPRSDYDVPSGRDLAGYYPRDDDTVSHHAIRNGEPINASYDPYLRAGQLPYAGSDGRLPGSGIPSYPVDDPRISGDPRLSSMAVVDPRVKGWNPNPGSARPEMSLPPDASSTLFVEGLPANCTRREVAHIFRPFVGYKEVRLVNKESRSGRDPLVLCFVDFASPPHAATALDALQGYKFDENDRDSAILNLQFARYPGARSGGSRSGSGRRGKR